jgi:hypothetical protein
MTRYLKEYASADKTIFDRSHISEAVYDELWRGGKAFTKFERKILDRLAIHNSIIIFARTNIEELRRRYNLRTYPQQISIEEIETSLTLFDRCLKDLPRLVYRSKNHNEIEEILTVVESKC